MNHFTLLTAFLLIAVSFQKPVLIKKADLNNLAEDSKLHAFSNMFGDVKDKSKEINFSPIEDTKMVSQTPEFSTIESRSTYPWPIESTTKKSYTSTTKKPAPASTTASNDAANNANFNYVYNYFYNSNSNSLRFNS
uniref:Uncharacterized protein n=1 Tax=Rhabditophanes sp. KR3021 TaxID=114890 RepID=A0AC35TNL4_9BILA